ncbi:hypothetical protein [Phenylobacterium sp.]|uniref:hypothetical protein n=1 Tax=Phenylobacterium sp. TaxID=1871053 RepID=UPI0035AF7884
MDLEQLSPELAEAVQNAGSPKDLDSILKKILLLYNPVLAPGAQGYKLFTPDLDKAIPHVGEVLRLHDRPGAKSNENVCIVASQFFQVGGHTRIAADISRLIGGARVTIILTETYLNTPYGALLQGRMDGIGLEHRAFILLKAPTMSERTMELYSILCAIQPTRIFLLNNHLDSCAVAATYPFRSITDFIHHCDHEPCLGATLPYATHADPTYGVHHHCGVYGVSAIYSSMTVPGLDITMPPLRDSTGPLRLATCGHLKKYRYPGHFRWADWAVACLQGHDAVMTHMGPVDEAFANEIRGSLTEAGIDPTRYSFVGPVASLRAELLRRGIDVYISSAPETGGRANLEALSARIPLLVPLDPNLPPLYRFDLPLSGWRSVERPDQMQCAIVECAGLSVGLRSDTYTAELRSELGRFEAFVLDAG